MILQKFDSLGIVAQIKTVTKKNDKKVKYDFVFWREFSEVHFTVFFKSRILLSDALKGLLVSKAQADTLIKFLGAQDYNLLRKTALEHEGQ